MQVDPNFTNSKQESSRESSHKSVRIFAVVDKIKEEDSDEYEMQELA